MELEIENRLSTRCDQAGFILQHFQLGLVAWRSVKTSFVNISKHHTNFDVTPCHAEV